MSTFPSARRKSPKRSDQADLELKKTRVAFAIAMLSLDELCMFWDALNPDKKIDYAGMRQRSIERYASMDAHDLSQVLAKFDL